MESRIGNILDRMNEENDRLKDLKSKYTNCQKMRKANVVHIKADIKKDKFELFDMPTDTVYLKLDGEIVAQILDLLEAYFCEQEEQCNRNLENMVVEMKEGSIRDNEQPMQ